MNLQEFLSYKEPEPVVRLEVQKVEPIVVEHKTKEGAKFRYFLVEVVKYRDEYPARSFHQPVFMHKTGFTRQEWDLLPEELRVKFADMNFNPETFRGDEESTQSESAQEETLSSTEENLVENVVSLINGE